MVEHAVVRNNCIRDSEFIQVTCYAALRYVADFKAGWSFGEGRRFQYDSGSSICSAQVAR